MCGQVAERIVAACLRLARDEHALEVPDFSPGDVRVISGLDLGGEQPRKRRGRTVDAAGYAPIDPSNPNAGYIPFGVEVKNIRSWIYPWDNEIWDLLSALGHRPDVVPVLVARRIHPITFNFLKDIGGLGHATYRQWFAWSGSTDDSLSAERFEEVVVALGFHDAERVENPDDFNEAHDPAMPAAHLVPEGVRRPTPKEDNPYAKVRPTARFFRFTVPKEIRAQADRWKRAAPIVSEYAELREASLAPSKRRQLWAEFAQLIRDEGLYARKQWAPHEFEQPEEDDYIDVAEIHDLVSFEDV